MFGFFDFYFGGGKIVGKIAEEIGIEKKLFKTALTEVHINFAHVKLSYRIYEGMGEAEALRSLAPEYLQPAFTGLELLARRFPNQPEIERGFSAIIRYKEYRVSELDDQSNQ